MPTGVIKAYVTDKGYGFLKCDDGGKDVFVHITELRRGGIEDPEVGDRMSFDVDPNPTGKGARAVNVVAA